MNILNTAQIRAVELDAFAKGMPVAALMEKAGILLAAHITKNFPAQQFGRVAVLVGPGHNGGDALVVARELLLSGREVIVWSDFPVRKELNQSHLNWFQSLGGQIVTQLNNPHFNSCDLFIDGLLGFGVTQATKEKIALAIDWLNAKTAPIVSIDVPSGLCSDTGAPQGSTVKATQTLMLSPARLGMFQNEALAFCGEVIDVNIGLCNNQVERVLSSEFTNQPRIQKLECEDTLEELLKLKSPNANKYSTGRALIVAGSKKYPGAAVLAALACKNLGAGYTAVDSCPETQNALLPLAPDIVFLSEMQKTSTSQETNNTHRKFDAILCGCGLDNQFEKLQDCLAANTQTLVLDADALNMISRSGTFPKTSAQVVITPHTPEFKRLFPELANIPLATDAALAAAKKTGAIVVLKGSRTVIATPNNEVFINTQSTAALARAGTGDVLAGMIVSLAAQGLNALESAKCAVWLHSQFALLLEHEHSCAGVDALKLANSISLKLTKLSKTIK